MDLPAEATAAHQVARDLARACRLAAALDDDAGIGADAGTGHTLASILATVDRMGLSDLQVPFRGQGRFFFECWSCVTG